MIEIDLGALILIDLIVFALCMAARGIVRAALIVIFFVVLYGVFVMASGGQG